MIDIHAHILPDIDDGSTDLSETIDILHELDNQGVTDVIATPHVMKDNFDNTRNTIIKRLKQVKYYLEDSGIDINIHFGAELYLEPSIVEKTKEQKLTLASSDYVLVESSFQRFPPNFEDILFHFQQEGYKPIIAHAERFRDFNSNFNYMVRILNRGFYVQMNCGSLFGDYGDLEQAFAMKMLDEGCVHLIASDLHGIERRPIYLKKAYNFISKNYSRSLAELLLVENPKRILNNEPLESMITETYWTEEKKSNFLDKIKNFISGIS